MSKDKIIVTSFSLTSKITKRIRSSGSSPVIGSSTMITLGDVSALVRFTTRRYASMNLLAYRSRTSNKPTFQAFHQSTVSSLPTMGHTGQTPRNQKLLTFLYLAKEQESPEEDTPRIPRISFRCFHQIITKFLPARKLVP